MHEVMNVMKGQYHLKLFVSKKLCFVYWSFSIWELNITRRDQRRSQKRSRSLLEEERENESDFILFIRFPWFVLIIYRNAKGERRYRDSS